ncbi:MAG: DUF2179 domain-containing protein, partial [Mycoplasma sp.]|nr:DUF2179 domain-containing protein [Mycoplasma sp.]
YSNKERKSITTTILLLELYDLVKIIKQIDPNCWISVTKIKETYGNFNTKSVD